MPNRPVNANARFISRIKALMAERGWNINELAARAGIQRVGLSNILRGVYEPKPVTLGKIAKAFGISPGQFIGPRHHYELSEEESAELDELSFAFVEEKRRYNESPEGANRRKLEVLTSLIDDSKVPLIIPILRILSTLDDTELSTLLDELNVSFGDNIDRATRTK